MQRRTKDTSDRSPGQFQLPLACKFMAQSNTTGKCYCSGMTTSFQTHNMQVVSAQYFEVNLPVFFEATLSILRHFYGWRTQLWLRTGRIRDLWALWRSCGIISPPTVRWVLKNAGCSLVKTYPSRFLDSKQSVFPKKKNSLRRTFSIWSLWFALLLRRRVLKVIFSLLSCARLYKHVYTRRSKHQTVVLFQTCPPVHPMYSTNWWPTFAPTQPVWMWPLYTHTCWD